MSSRFAIPIDSPLARFRWRISKADRNFSFHIVNSCQEKMADAKSRYFVFFTFPLFRIEDLAFFSADALLQMMKQGSAAQKRPAEPPSTTEKTETTEKIEKEEDKEKEKETPEDVKSEKDDAGPSSPKKIRTEEKDDFE